MEVTARRIMKVVREVDAYLLTIPELSNYVTPPYCVQDGINIIRRLANKSGCAWQTYVPEIEIAHVGVDQAIEIRSLLVNATDIQAAIENAKDFYEKQLREFL